MRAPGLLSNVSEETVWTYAEVYDDQRVGLPDEAYTFSKGPSKRACISLAMSRNGQEYILFEDGPAWVTSFVRWTPIDSLPF